MLGIFLVWMELPCFHNGSKEIISYEDKHDNHHSFLIDIYLTFIINKDSKNHNDPNLVNINLLIS